MPPAPRPAALSHPASAPDNSRVVVRIAASVRAVLSELRHLPDRLLHARRRRKALRALVGLAPRSTLFICHGNICRSPFAASVFERATRGRPGPPLEVRSAGFIGPGRQPPDNAIAAAARRGHDLRDHRSALITEHVLASSDLIVVMAPEQAAVLRRRPRIAGRIVVLGDLDPEPVDRRAIRDPWNCDDSVFDASYARIERCLAALIAALPPSASREGRR